MGIQEAILKVLDHPLTGFFIGSIKDRWSGLDQRRRRLRQLVAMVRGVVDAARAAARRRGGALSAWLDELSAEALRGQQALDAAAASAAAVNGGGLVAGLWALYHYAAEVHRLAEAIDALERLAGPGGDLAMFAERSIRRR